MKYLLNAVVATAILGMLATPAAAAPVRSQSIHLQSVPRQAVAALCLRFSKAGQASRITRQQAIQAVENMPILRRYRKHVPITEAVVARVRARIPVLTGNHHPMWVLVSHQAHGIELYFVDAQTGKLVSYMLVGGGCRQ